MARTRKKNGSQHQDSPLKETDNKFTTDEAASSKPTEDVSIAASNEGVQSKSEVAQEDAGQSDGELEVSAEAEAEHHPEKDVPQEQQQEPITEPAAPQPAYASIVPMVVGGMIAALVGFLVARYLDDTALNSSGAPTTVENAAATAELSDRVVDIQSQLQDVASTDNTAEIEAVVQSSTDPLSTEIAEVEQSIISLSEQLDALSDRIETIALRPETSTTLDPGEFDEALGQFRAQLSEAIEQAQVEIAEARAEASQISEQAFQAEQAALARSAWTQVQAALDSGAPFAEPLAETASIVDIELPEALTISSKEGVPSLSELQQSFPDVARAALAASIRESVDGNAMDRLGAFLRVQTGARSLSPRDGDDPDAILSRAEAAVQSGELSVALGELDAMPETGKAQLSEWIEQVRTRLVAVEAAETVSQTLNSN